MHNIHNLNHTFKDLEEHNHLMEFSLSEIIMFDSVMNFTLGLTNYIYLHKTLLCIFLIFMQYEYFSVCIIYIHKIILKINVIVFVN